MLVAFLLAAYMVNYVYVIEKLHQHYLLIQPTAAMPNHAKAFPSANKQLTQQLKHGESRHCVSC